MTVTKYILIALMLLVIQAQALSAFNITCPHQNSDSLLSSSNSNTSHIHHAMANTHSDHTFVQEQSASEQLTDCCQDQCHCEFIQCQPNLSASVCTPNVTPYFFKVNVRFEHSFTYHTTFLNFLFKPPIFS